MPETMAAVADRVREFLLESGDAAPRLSAARLADVLTLCTYASSRPGAAVPGELAALFAAVPIENTIYVPPAGKLLTAIEGEALLISLRHAGGSQTRAGELLGMSRGWVNRHLLAMRRGSDLGVHDDGFSEL